MSRYSIGERIPAGYIQRLAKLSKHMEQNNGKGYSDSLIRAHLKGQRYNAQVEDLITAVEDSDKELKEQLQKQTA